MPGLEDLAVFLGLLGSSTRLKLIYLLGELKELCVCDMADILGVSVSAVSQHLAKLRAYGVVKTRREKQTIYYSLSGGPRHKLLLAMVDEIRRQEEEE